MNQPCWGHPKHTRTRITTQMGTGTIWGWVGATLGAKRGCPGITHNMELLYGTRIWVSWFWLFEPLPYLTEGTSLQVISPYVVQKSSDQLAGCVGQLTDSSQTTYQKHFFEKNYGFHLIVPCVLPQNTRLLWVNHSCWGHPTHRRARKQPNGGQEPFGGGWGLPEGLIGAVKG